MREVLREYNWDWKLWAMLRGTAGMENGTDNELFTLSCGLKVRLIGIGAAARFFLPAVAERLHTEVIFPQDYEVGNAVGAALSAVEI